MALLHGSFEEKYEVLARLRQGGMGRCTRCGTACWTSCGPSS